MLEPGSPRTAPALRIALGLALTPLTACAVAEISSSLRLDLGVGNALAFTGGALLPLLGLGLAARVLVALRLQLAVAACAAVILLGLALHHFTPLRAMLLVDLALPGLGWALGTAIGMRVEHASHLLPACVVAACADTISLLSPEGPTHAIAESERALSLAATWFPVPGTNAFAPALGLGDLLFSALVFAVASRHSLPYVRAVLLVGAGAALAGVAAAWLGVAVPALVPIAAAVLLGLPTVRAVRPADRAATRWSIVIAGALLVTVLARSLLTR